MMVDKLSAKADFYNTIILRKERKDIGTTAYNRRKWYFTHLEAFRGRDSLPFCID
jgi:hypothetical protein